MLRFEVFEPQLLSQRRLSNLRNYIKDNPQLNQDGGNRNSFHSHLGKWTTAKHQQRIKDNVRQETTNQCITIGLGITLRIESCICG